MTGHENMSHIADWEKGRRLPTLENALRLSAAIACPIEVLFSHRFYQIRKEITTRTRGNSPFRQYLISNINKNANYTENE
jgi:transcriptional regulator with XRE-family HTH domain